MSDKNNFIGLNGLARFDERSGDSNPSLICELARLHLHKTDKSFRELSVYVVGIDESSQRIFFSNPSQGVKLHYDGRRQAQGPYCSFLVSDIMTYSVEQDFTQDNIPRGSLRIKVELPSEK